MSSPKKIVCNEDAVNDAEQWRSSISQVSSATLNHFLPLSIEEQHTRRKWRGATIAFYFSIAIFCVCSSILGPLTQTTAKHNPAYSSIGSSSSELNHRLESHNLSASARASDAPK